MIVGIHQPNYIPWLGFFQKVVQSDIFVLYDNLQMPMGKSFLSRCKIKSPDGGRWLTVPTPKSGTPKLIGETSVLTGPWLRKHLGSLQNWYAGSPWVDEVCAILEEEVTAAHSSIGALNGAILIRLTRLIGAADTRFIWASQMEHGITGADSILPILKELGASIYLTGQGAGSQRYLNEAAFTAEGIEILKLETEFKHYTQRHGEFVQGLSILDAILNIGPVDTLSLIR
jgi:hypothetical protein